MYVFRYKIKPCIWDKHQTYTGCGQKRSPRLTSYRYIQLCSLWYYLPPPLLPASAYSKIFIVKWRHIVLDVYIWQVAPLITSINLSKWMLSGKCNSQSCTKTTPEKLALETSPQASVMLSRAAAWHTDVRTDVYWPPAGPHPGRVSDTDWPSPGQRARADRARADRAGPRPGTKLAGRGNDATVWLPYS